MLRSQKSVRKYLRKLSSNFRSIPGDYSSHNYRYILQVLVRDQLHSLALRSNLTIESSLRQTWLQSRFSPIIRRKFLSQRFVFAIICFVKFNTLITPWLLVRKRIIQTERPPLVGEVIANICG
jgi:hypothetical protein